MTEKLAYESKASVLSSRASETISWLRLSEQDLVRLVSRQLGGNPLLYWPRDLAQSQDLLNSLEAQLADGHRKSSNFQHYTTAYPFK